MQRCQLAVVSNADVYAVNAQLVQCRADLCAERKIAPFRVLGEPHDCAICGYVARNADLDSDQVLFCRQPVELRTQRAVKFGKASVGRSPAEICRHTVPRQLATCECCRGELKAIQVDAYPENAPWFAVEVDGTSRSTGAWTANRVELHDDPACPEFADEIGHCGNAEAAAVCNVVTAASSMVAHVAKDLGEISLT